MSLFWLLTDYLGNHFVTHIPFWYVRKVYYFLCGADIGEGSQMDMDVIVMDPNRLKLGNHTHINRNCLLDARGTLSIGDCVSISQRVVIVTGSHNYKSPHFDYVRSEIYIDNYVWIGVNATIIGDVHIGEGAVVCAGAVVTKDVEPYTVVAGVPAKPIRTRPHNLDYTPLQGLYWFPHFI
jgi:acetyltransferase-like isoleucine patch superfamily enzyme